MKWSKTNISEWFSTIDNTGALENVDDVERKRYLAALRTNPPSSYISDHYRESWSLKSVPYIAINVLEKQAASSECHYHRKLQESKESEGQQENEALKSDHPIVKLINRPNSIDSRHTWLRRIVQQLYTTGTYLGWRVDNGLNQPEEIWTVPTATYTPMPPSETYPKGAYRILPFFPGPMSYLPGAAPNVGVIVPAEQMLVIRFPHNLVYWEGMSPLSACDSIIDVLTSIDRSRFNFFKRSIAPSAVLESDPETIGPFDDEEIDALRIKLRQQLAGPERTGELFHLPKGCTLKPYEDFDKEMAYIDSWNQMVDACLSIFGVTKSLAFMGEDATYSNLYSALKQFNLFTLKPLLDLISDNINLQVIEPFYGEEYCIEFAPKSVVNEELIEDQISNDMKGGVRLVKEIREVRGLPILGEPWEDERCFEGRAAEVQEEADTAGGTQEPSSQGGKKPKGQSNALPSRNGSAKKMLELLR